MKAWQRIDDGRDIAQVGFRTITKKRFLMNSGAAMTADVTDKDGAGGAGVFALTKNNEIIIARQFRCGPEEVLDEIPAGIIDDGESPLEAVKRELLEETGYVSDNFEYLGKIYANAWSNSIEHYFIATDCYRTTDILNLDEFEEVEVVTMSVMDFINNAKKGKMTNTQGMMLAIDKLIELENIK